MGNLVSRAVRSTAEVAIGKADLNDDRRRDGDQQHGDGDANNNLDQGTDALPPLSKRRKVCGEAVPEEQKALSEVPETPVREEDKAVDVKPSLSEREAAVPHREPAHSSSPIQATPSQSRPRKRRADEVSSSRLQEISSGDNTRPRDNEKPWTDVRRGWTYVGLLNGVCDRAPDEEVPPGYMRCPDGRCYPFELTYKPGDKRLDEFTQEDENPDAEYIVDCILDEKQRKGKSMYRLKWAGYQMHPHEWIPKSYLKNCVALEEWDAEQAKAPSAL